MSKKSVAVGLLGLSTVLATSLAPAASAQSLESLLSGSAGFGSPAADAPTNDGANTNANTDTGADTGVDTGIGTGTTGMGAITPDPDTDATTDATPGDAPSLGGFPDPAPSKNSQVIINGVVNTYPETPKTNPELPYILTTHGSDHLKANVLNPRPVCNSAEDYRTSVYQVNDDFIPVGTVSMRNDSANPVPLTQTTSRQQSISISVNGSRTEKLDANIGGSGKQGDVTGQGGIAYSLATVLGGQASFSLSWSVGQEIGPYTIDPGNTGEATYGFRIVNMTGTQQFCRPNGTWSTPTAWRALVPIKNEVVVKQYSNIAGSFGGTSPNTGNQGGTGTGTNTGTDTSVPANGLDLQPYLTVSALKSPGFAGAVALRIKNVGDGRYYQDNLATTFRVDIHTAKGPQGVDRLITPRFANGAYVRDLGFDAETSVRSFEVTLSNAINVDDDQLIGMFDFGDGNTTEGRLINYITVTQTGRAAGDVSFDNDQNVDSRQVTVDDFGGKNAGLF